jgi:hypothetical protein
MKMTASHADIERCMLELLGARAEMSSICPSDVARALAPDESDWRALMPAVRHVAARLARDRTIVITQGDATLDSDHIDHGPIRLRRGARFSR